MTLIYGHAWVSRYGDSIEGIGAGVWSRALAELTPHQIKIGIEACENSASEWPPSIPKFRALALGIPSLAQVKYNVRTSTGGLFMPILWRYIDGYRLRQSSEKDAERMIADAYELAVNAVLSGEACQAAPQVEYDTAEHDERERKLYDEAHMKRMADFGYSP